MNRLRLQPPDGRAPFEATVTEDGQWDAGDLKLELDLESAAMRFHTESYKLSEIHRAAATLLKAWPGSALLSPIVHYPTEDENGDPIVY